MKTSWHVGLTTADPAKQVPIGFWMHRGCVPFISPKQFQSHYWPTLRPCIEEFWKHGNQTMFYAEGKWDHHLDDFATLPERSILFHVDQGDIFLAHKKLHRQIRAQRRHPERAAQLRQTRRSPRALPEGH